MKQNYFVVDGAKYYTGTVFMVNEMNNTMEASFVYYDTDKDRYIYKIQDCIYNVNHENFQRKFICVTSKANLNVHMPVEKRQTDLEVDGVFIGWLWYIFLMAVSAIFKDAIGLWIVISIAFFTWRHKKIEEEGTYIEW